MKKSTETSFSLTVLSAIMVVTLVPLGAGADENCCLNNYRFAGGCMVVARGSETCSSILSYLNSFDSVGKYYCDNTTIRGGWTVSTCNDPAQSQPEYITPQSSEPTERIQQNQQPIGSAQPQTAPAASDASLMQVSAPLQVQFDSDLDTSTQGAGHTVTGTLQQDLMDGDTVIAPAGSQVNAQVVPTSFWSDGSGDSYQIQATGIQVGENVIPDQRHRSCCPGRDRDHRFSAQGPPGLDGELRHRACRIIRRPATILHRNGSRWMEAFNNSRCKGLAALYAPDAVILPPNEPAVFGRDAIRATHQELFAEGDFKIDIEALETVIDGQLAYVAGRYRMWTGDGDLVDRGKYIEIWRPVDGEWMIYRDIYNSSIALPTAEETTD